MLTPRQQKIRARHVTASEVPAIMGSDPYRSAVDVFMEKTGRVRPPEYSEAMAFGHDCEPMMLEWFKRQTGKKVTRNNVIRTNGVMSCTKDAFVVGENEGVQIKSSGVEGGSFAVSDEWGDPGTDQVPVNVLLQCMAEMCVDGTVRTWVPALLGGVGRRLYVVERDEKLIELVRGWAEWFHDHVVRDVMPTGAPKIETLKRLIREPGKTISIPDDLVLMWSTARNMRLNAEKLEKEAERNLLAALGDAEAGESGVGCVTYMETVRKGYTVGESRYRTLRVKNTKKEIGHGGAEGSADRGQDAGGADGARLAAERLGGGIPSGADVRPVGAGAEGDGAP